MTSISTPCSVMQKMHLRGLPGQRMQNIGLYKVGFVQVTKMKIDFNDIDTMTFTGMNNGTGSMSARMYNDDYYRIIPTAIHPGGSIGNHKQESGDDMNYIISGTGKAFCDGAEEELRPGVMHICPKGSEGYTQKIVLDVRGRDIQRIS